MRGRFFLERYGVTVTVIAGLIAGAWAIFVYALPSSKEAGVHADCGSVAVGRDVSGSTITAGGSDCSKNRLPQ
jgi:hypothetical protein